MIEKKKLSNKKCCEITNMVEFVSMKLFKYALTEALDKTGMTAIALSIKATVNRSRISQFAAGNSLPKDETIVAICGAFPEPHVSSLAKAWVRERLGSTLGDVILASGSADGSDIEQLYSSLPTAAANAFRLLMELAREDTDLRQSIVSLAAFAKPDSAAFQITQIIDSDTQIHQGSPSQEISKPPATTTAMAAASPSTTSVSPPTKPTAKHVKLREHIMPESVKKAAEEPSTYKTPKNGTED